MCICCYLGDTEYTDPTSNEVINELLQEVRQATGDDWRIQESVVKTRPGWLRSERTVSVYTIYNHIHCTEFQVMNFYCSEDKDSSIHISCSADVMAAYLYGILATCHK